MTTHKHNKKSLVFDDDPLDGVLYGVNVKDPTPADCFLAIKDHMRTIRDAANSHDNTALLSALTVITKGDMALHRPICDEIIDITKTLIPNVPLPALSHDIVSLTPLLERIWALHYEPHGYARRQLIGNRLYRCYEHQRRYAEARRILESLIRAAQERGNHSDEAVYTNNLAFEYLLETRWQDAMPLFQYAEKLLFKQGEDFDAANARANYMTCIFSLCPDSDLAEYEELLNDLTQVLSKGNNWRARKPFVLLSKIRESLNDLEGAISYMHSAISASEEDHLRWTEIDQARLSDLEAKR